MNKKTPAHSPKIELLLMLDEKITNIANKLNWLCKELGYGE